MSETTVINIKSGEKYDINIMRPGRWSNPYSHLPFANAILVSSREEAIQKFEYYLRTTPKLLNIIGELEGKILGCCCKPKACHGDIYIKLLREKKWF